MPTAYENRRNPKACPLTPLEVNTEGTAKALTMLREEVALRLTRPGYTGTVGVKLFIKDGRITGVDALHSGTYK